MPGAQIPDFGSWYPPECFSLKKKILGDFIEKNFEKKSLIFFFKSGAP